MKCQMKLESGMIVQINPETVRNHAFSGCLMTVESVSGIGALCVLQSVGERSGQRGPQFSYHANWDEILPLSDGKAVWCVAVETAQ
jgi:hypothetical protein